MKIYGLTGGIASGKSFAARIFAELGATVVDADQVARDVLAKGTPTYEQAVLRFGTGILAPDGSIDRPRMRELIFTDPEAKARLDELTHPPIIGQIAGRIREHFERDKAPVIVEAALLIETAHPFPFNGLIVVYCSQRKQLQRLMQRDGVTREQALAALAAQMPMKEKVTYADYVLRNNGGEKSLRRQVERLWSQLKEQD